MKVEILSVGLGALLLHLFNAAVYVLSGEFGKWHKDYSIPAITDVGRRNHIYGNIYTATMTIFAMVMFMISRSLTKDALPTALAAIGSLGVMLTAIFEGNEWGDAHAFSCLIGVGCLLIWFVYMSTPKMRYLAIGSLAVFLMLFNLRTDQAQRYMFIVGEYSLLILGIAGVSSLYSSLT